MVIGIDIMFFLHLTLLLMHFHVRHQRITWHRPQLVLFTYIPQNIHVLHKIISFVPWLPNTATVTELGGQKLAAWESETTVHDPQNSARLIKLLLLFSICRARPMQRLKEYQPCTWSQEDQGYIARWYSYYSHKTCCEDEAVSSAIRKILLAIFILLNLIVYCIHTTITHEVS